MKRLLCLYFTLILALLLVSCGGMSDAERLRANSWESSVDILTFTESGKVLRNFESEEDSVSYYKLEDGKINMYTEEGEEFGILFDYSFEGDNFILGNVVYSPVEEKESETTADGMSEPFTEQNSN